jgi:hypothetical protein
VQILERSFTPAEETRSLLKNTFPDNRNQQLAQLTGKTVTRYGDSSEHLSPCTVSPYNKGRYAPLSINALDQTESITMARKQSNPTAKTEPTPDWQKKLMPFLEPPWPDFSPDLRLPELDKAIMEKARQDPEGLMTEGITMMVAFELRVLVRTQWIVSRWLHEWDRLNSHSPEAPPIELAAAVDQMARIEDHLTNLMTRHARLRHVAGLAEETKAVRGTARKFREALRVVAHPVTPEIEAAAGEEATEEPLEKVG